ncbi:MAG: O-acetylhomoserine aminocarboxypropyltransferase/cysteine synthase family protein [Clostridia bacterium]
MNQGLNTKLLHAGYTSEETTKSRAVPIYMTTAYSFDSAEHAASLFDLSQAGNIYTRLQNPTSDVLEQRMAAIEGGVGALATSSGHSAIFMTMITLAQQGDEIISSMSIYGGAVNLLDKTLRKMGIDVKFANADDPSSFEALITDKTKAIFLEIIGNPNANLIDLKAICEIGAKYGIPVIADNTVATPYLIKPIEFGANIVIHSTTKYISGTGTSMGGVVVDAGNFKWEDNPRFPEFNTPDPSYKGLIFAKAVGNLAFIIRLRTNTLRDIGACQSPMNSWLTLQGLETLSLRMERHCSNALAVAKYLEASDAVINVNYPALESSPYYALQQEIIPKGASSMFTFNIKGGKEAGIKFINSVKLLSHVANLGDSRSLVSHPASTTHSQLNEEALNKANITSGTIRLSVGYEDIEDILADIAQALEISQQ